MKQQWIEQILVACGVGVMCLTPANLSPRLNILLITADDMHWDSVGDYGWPVAVAEEVERWIKDHRVRPQTPSRPL